MSSIFLKRVINYAKLHPDDPNSAFLIESVIEMQEKRKKEAEKWRLISTAMQNYESRHRMDLRRTSTAVEWGNET